MLSYFIFVVYYTILSLYLREKAYVCLTTLITHLLTVMYIFTNFVKNLISVIRLRNNAISLFGFEYRILKAL
jgi:hypothetical protein